MKTRWFLPVVLGSTLVAGDARSLPRERSFHAAGTAETQLAGNGLGLLSRG